MRKKSHSENEKKRIDVPYFLLGFCHDGIIPYLCILATHGYANYR